MAGRKRQGMCWLVGSMLLIAIAAHASPAWAQAPPSDLGETLQPGRTVWITQAGAAEVKTRIISVSAETITGTVDGTLHRFRTEDVRRVRARYSDSVLNGALIGAGSAIAAGLVFCTAMEPWDVCRQNYGAMVRIGALGAGIGIGVDALIRGGRTVYQAEPSRVYAAPLLGGRRGVQFSVRF